MHGELGKVGNFKPLWVELGYNSIYNLEKQCWRCQHSYVKVKFLHFSVKFSSASGGDLAMYTWTIRIPREWGMRKVEKGISLWLEEGKPPLGIHGLLFMCSCALAVGVHITEFHGYIDKF